MTPREYLREQMLELGQFSYLLCYAVDRLSHEAPASISKDAPAAISGMCRDPDKLHGGTYQIEVEEAIVKKRLPGLQTWAVQALLLRLDAVMHGVLDRLHNRPPEDDSGKIEADVSRLLPASERSDRDIEWAYRDVVLLAVYRNCVAHSDGKLHEERHQRLVNAGWTETGWTERIAWENPRYEDFLLFKKAVRTLGSACIDAASK